MIDIIFDRFGNEAHLLLAARCQETWVAQLLPSLSVHISEYGGQKVKDHGHGHGVDDGYKGSGQGIPKVWLSLGKNTCPP